MSRIVGALLKQFGPTASSGSAPTAPTLAVTDNADGTGGVATISGADVGTTNEVFYRSISGTTWTSAGSRSGSGIIAVNPGNGIYWWYAVSTSSGGASISSLIFQALTAGPYALSLTPSGSLGKHIAGVAYLIASTARFQTLTGAASAAIAFKSFLHYEAFDKSADAPRPRAIVDFGESYNRQRVGTGSFAEEGSIVVTFEAEPSATNMSPWDELVEFCNHVDTIIREALALAGQGTGYFANETHVNAIQWAKLVPPCRDVDTGKSQGGQGQQVYYGCVFQVRVLG